MKKALKLLCVSLVLLGIFFGLALFNYFGVGIGGKGMSHVPYRKDLTPRHIDEKYGYVDENNNIVIEPQFDWARLFTEGLGAVKIGEHWGYINEAGEMIIAPKYDDAYDFLDGVADVQFEGAWRQIDKSGNIVELTEFQRERRDLKSHGLWGSYCVMFVTGIAGFLNVLAIGILCLCLLLRKTS